MKALVFHGARDIRYEEVETPHPGPDEVLIKVKAVSICGSDLSGFKGTNPMRVAPLIMGHEFAGEVAALGENVKNAQVGDKVGVITNLFCGECPDCQAGLPNVCDHRKIIGTTMKAGGYNGAMADYVVAPAEKLLPLTGKLSFEEYSLMEPLSISLRATKHAGDLHGKTVMVIGCGPIGLLAIKCIKRFGAGCIIATDVMEDRLQAARESGADHVISSNEDVLAFTRKITNQAGVDVVFDAAGVPATVNLSVDLVRMGGKVIWIGLSAPKIDFEYKHAVCKEINFQGSYMYITEMEEGLGLLESGEVKVGHLITSVMPMSEGPRIFQELASGQTKDIKVVLTND